MLELTEQNFEEHVLNSQQPVLVDFWAPWCGPCKMLEPTVDEVANEMSDIVVGKVNIDEQSGLAQRYSVMSVPTLLFFKGGQVMDQMVGVQDKASITTKLNELK